MCGGRLKTENLSVPSSQLSCEPKISQEKNKRSLTNAANFRFPDFILLRAPFHQVVWKTLNTPGFISSSQEV